MLQYFWTLVSISTSDEYAQHEAHAKRQDDTRRARPPTSCGRFRQSNRQCAALVAVFVQPKQVPYSTRIF
jgi:hypothetical protein